MAFLTDFGLTKGLQAGGTQLTGTGQWIGTLDYVAPEQMTDGRVDARTDVYALGCVLYEALTGSVPFPGTDMQKMWGHVNEPLPASASDERLASVVAKATEKDPDARFQSAGDLARAATAAIAGEAAPAPAGSVATGAAASGLQDATDPAPRTRTMKAAPPAPSGDRQTATMAGADPPTERRPRVDDRGPGTRVAAAIGGSLVLAAGLIGAALIFAGGDGSSGTSTVVTTATGSASSADGEARGAPGEEPAPAEGSASGGSVRYSQAFYSIEIPAGWEQEASDEPSGNPPGAYLESVWRDPAEPNTSITVDAQTPEPDAPPLESAESVRAETSQSSSYREVAFEPTELASLPGARWIFQIAGDDGVVDRRVDYFLNACGAGVAVLGSTTPGIFGSLAPTFHRAAVSVATPCAE